VFRPFNGATGLILSSEEIDLIVGRVEAATETASIGDLGVFSDSIVLAVSVLACSSACLFRSANIKGLVRAAGVFLTGSTIACLPLAPFQAGR
jgi:hypothetical protein